MSLEKDFRQEQVVHLDAGTFTRVESGMPVKDVVEKMRRDNHNCAIITDNGALVGIFTDRDLLRKVVDVPDTWGQAIDSVMTPAPITVKSTAPAYAALELMDEKHFRNVPVVDENGLVVGNLTHYAIIKYLADRFPEAVYNLPPEPNRVSKNRDGA